jgi:hypothetical protein
MALPINTMARLTNAGQSPHDLLRSGDRQALNAADEDSNLRARDA